MRHSGRHHHRGKSSEASVDVALVLGALGIGPGQTILDAGCGNGYMAKAFARVLGGRGRVVALDPDEEAIAVLAAETAGTTVEAMVGDITTDTGLPASSADLVYLSTVFHGFTAEEIAGFRDEVERLLRPDGTLAIVEIVKKPTPFGPPMEIRCSPEELRRIVGMVPGRTVEVGEFHFMQLFDKGEDGGRGSGSGPSGGAGSVSTV